MTDESSDDDELYEVELGLGFPNEASGLLAAKDKMHYSTSTGGIWQAL